MDMKSSENKSTMKDTVIDTNTDEEVTEEKELDEILLDDLMEEYDGVIHYVDLSKKLPEEYKSILVSMAKEERTHAQLIEEILKDMNKACFNKEILEKKSEADKTLETV